MLGIIIFILLCCLSLFLLKPKKDVNVLEETLSANDLVYLSEQAPPLNYTEGTSSGGISIEIIDKIFLKLGSNFSRKDIVFSNWSDAYQSTLKDNKKVLFSTVRLPAREKLFKWVGPIIQIKNVVIAKKSLNTTVSSVDDLKKIKIGVIEDDFAETELVTNGLSKEILIREKEMSVLISKLDQGAIDAIAYGDIPAWYLLKKFSVNFSEYRVVHEIGKYEVYYAFSKETPDYLISQFQSAFEAIKKEKGADGVSEYEKIIYRYVEPECAVQTTAKEDVLALINSTASEIGSNATSTLDKINSGQSPYKSTSNKDLYVFVYDANYTMVAHADNKSLIGVNYLDKTDVSGKKFRNLIVEGALAKGTGSEDYIYINPAYGGLYYKTTYYKLVKGSDGKDYVVCAGNYKKCE